ncbi:MAG TPA: amidohydrolase [Bryobacteraceae bacterium]|nr:amidohydrolase [Bryobacteraceae bacterium]
MFADTVLVHGKIWTEDAQKPEAEAVAIEGNRILRVGTSAQILKLAGPGTRVIELGGRRVTPGFNDSHVHFLQGGAGLASVQLVDAASQAIVRERIAAFAKTRPKGEWILNGFWDHEKWTPAQIPNHELIDDVTPDNPVFVQRLDGHMALANAVAMKLAGVDKTTKDMAGGVIVRDAEGNPTGIFKDAATELIERVIPPPTQAQLQAAAEAAQKYARENGVTSVQDMSAAPDALRAYEHLLRQGKLQVRVSGHQPLPSWKRLAGPGVESNFGGEMLHIGGLKGFADGSLGSTTAWFFKPYLDTPNTSGIASDELSKPEEMYANIRDADREGLQVAIHAIGDRAIHTILDFYERVEKENGARDRRFRIEHAQHLLWSDIPRFAGLQVIASMQPYHCIDDGRWAAKRLDAERLKTTYAFRSLLDSGATLAFGSDWPVAPMVPLMGIYAAATRRTLDGRNPGGWIPEQKITVAEAVHAYTIGSAFAEGEENIKGSILPGKLADLVVLSDDIFHIDPVQIEKTHVDLTIFDGKVTFQREGAAILVSTR